MKLYMIPECPFVHRVLLACDVRKIDSSLMQKIQIDLNQPPAALLKINPSGSVPTLEFEQGQGFHESLVIMEFCDSLSAPGPKIYGANARQIAETKVLWETINSRVLSAVQQAIYSFGNVNSLRTAATQLEKAWVWLEEQLQNRGTTFFGGTELNAVDIGMAPFLMRLGYVCELHPMIKLPAPQSKAAEYLKNLKNRCAESQVFPSETVMRDTTLKFARPHKLFLDVQNAPRTLIENPNNAVANESQDLSSWKVERDDHGYCLRASFSFASHTEAVEKIKWLHDAQEICDHHTSFQVKNFTTIDIELVTHEPRWGVTQKDLTMAKLLQCYFLKGSLPA